MTGPHGGCAENRCGRGGQKAELAGAGRIRGRFPRIQA